VLYADDLLLFCPSRSQEDSIQIQGDVSMIEDWMNSNYLTLNVQINGCVTEEELKACWL